MDSSLSVRTFASSDAGPLTQLLHSAYAELGAVGLNFTAVDQSVETTLLRAGGGQCWVVERHSELVATLTMSLPPSQGLIALTTQANVKDRAWLNQVAVSPHLRHSGIATHLWELSRTWAAKQGATSIGVDTAEPAKHLVSLYRRWGFRAKGTIRWSGKTYDSVVMIRPVQADGQ
jgi:GNAT superfamily N-acetyltransferase